MRTLARINLGGYVREAMDRRWLAVEWKPQDLWVGAFWKVTNWWKIGKNERRELEVYVCLLPMLPIHLHWTQWRPFVAPTCLDCGGRIDLLGDCDCPDAGQFRSGAVRDNAAHEEA